MMKGNIWEKVVGVGMAFILIWSTPTLIKAENNTKFSFDKEQVVAKVNNEFKLALEGSNITDLYGFEVALSYDEDKVEIVGKPEIEAIQGFSVGPKRADDQKVYFGCTQMGKKQGISGNLKLGEVTFKAKAAGSYPITLETITVIHSDMTSDQYKVGQNIKVMASNSSSSLQDIKGHWAEEAINKVVNAGYMIGKTESQFMPKDYLTRAETAVILNRIVDSKEIGTNIFTDIKGTEWYADSILKMSSQSLISGYEDGTFRPKSQITRAETVVLLARIYSNTYDFAGRKAVIKGYKDVDKVPEWAQYQTAWAVTTGVIKGDNNNQLNMDANMTRAEFAAILCRLLEL